MMPAAQKGAGDNQVSFSAVRGLPAVPIAPEIHAQTTILIRRR